jgi:hypothetical protein
LFGTELGTYERYLPDDETLAAVAPRVRLLVSADGLAPYTEAARRLGQRLGRDVDTTPGTPRGLPRPSDRVRAGIRRLLKELTAIRPYTAPAAVAYSDARDDQPSREGRALVAALPIRRKKRRCATETSVLRHNERRSECRSQTEAGTAFGYWRETS